MDGVGLREGDWEGEGVPVALLVALLVHDWVALKVGVGLGLGLTHSPLVTDT